MKIKYLKEFDGGVKVIISIPPSDLLRLTPEQCDKVKKVESFGIVGELVGLAFIWLLSEKP
jgi:hypothetical protein